jgi:hypothetical protein
VTGWRVHSGGQKIPVQPGWYLSPQKIPLAENWFLQVGTGAKNTKEKSRQCKMEPLTRGEKQTTFTAQSSRNVKKMPRTSFFQTPKT